MNKENETHGKTSHTEKAGHQSSSDRGGTNSHAHTSTATEKASTQHDAKHASSTHGTNSHAHTSAATGKASTQHDAKQPSSTHGTNSHAHTNKASEKPTTHQAKQTKNSSKENESLLSRILSFPKRIWNSFS